jgi:hypothetical protein
MMRNSWLWKLGVTVLSAATLAGCQRGQDRTAIDQATDQQRQNQQITISGCLGTGIGTNQFMVTAVQLLAPAADQPSGAPLTTGNPITPDAQVRLAYSETEELGRLVGQKVTVTGHVTDDGRNTIGTSGPNQGHTPANGKLESRDDKSAAATDQHHSGKVRQEAGPIGQQSMANGTFPEMRVTKINGSGEKCNTWPTTERR